MIRVLSDLKLVQRIDFDATDGLLASGYQGSWVTWDNTAQKVDLTTGATLLAWPIFNENELGNATGGKFSPDVEELKKVTVLYGKFRGLTDQYTGNVTTGNGADTGAGGVLDCDNDTKSVVIQIRELSNVVYRGVTYTNLLEFVSI
jgi:hypothetical protein